MRMQKVWYWTWGWSKFPVLLVNISGLCIQFLHRQSQSQLPPSKRSKLTNIVRVFESKHYKSNKVYLFKLISDNICSQVSKKIYKFFIYTRYTVKTLFNFLLGFQYFLTATWSCIWMIYKCFIYVISTIQIYTLDLYYPHCLIRYA